MAVVTKQKARKHSAAGPVNVGYGNYPIPGLLRNQHVNLTVHNSSSDKDARTHYVRMPMEEASMAAIQILRIAMEHDGLKFSTVKGHLLKRSLGSSFIPTEE